MWPPPTARRWTRRRRGGHTAAPGPAPGPRWECAPTRPSPRTGATGTPLIPRPSSRRAVALEHHGGQRLDRPVLVAEPGQHALQALGAGTRHVHLVVGAAGDV